MRQEFLLPDPGEGLTDAEVATWLVAPGDQVNLNQPVVEVETAKSLVELPSPWDGVVIELLAPEGATVAVGAPILAVEVADAEPAPTADDDAPGASDGDGSGAVLVGYGTKTSHGAPRRHISRPGANPALATAETAARVAAVPVATPAAPASPAADDPGMPELEAGVLAKPPVRKLARDLGIDLAALVGTGPGGIITRDDVLSYHQAIQADAFAVYPGDEPWLVGGMVSPDGRRTRVPVKSVRRRTAEAVVASAFTAPHVSVTHTVDVTRTMDLLAKLKEDREFDGLRLTPLLLVMKALLFAVHRHPEINASWDDENQEIVFKHYVNLGIAASTPRGLVVPNIKDAHRLSLKDLARQLGELTKNARAGKTTLTDMSDGTITITNVGAFGIDTGTPILNPGEAAILAFGAVRQQPWMRDGQIVPAFVTTLTLSFDHRLVDGELGALVLRDVCRILEDPAQALVWG